MKPAFFERFFSLAHQKVKLAAGCVFGDFLVPLVVVERGYPLDNLESLAKGQFPYGLFDFLNGAHRRIRASRAKFHAKIGSGLSKSNKKNPIELLILQQARMTDAPP